MFEFKPDYEQCKQRIDAFWERELLDRPPVQFTLAKPRSEQKPLPPSYHASAAERWLDAEYQAQWALTSLSNQLFLGDSMPVAFPNLGPEVLSSFYGCPIRFGDYGTSWTEPIIEDWRKVDTVQMNWHSHYLQKLQEMTEVLLAVGKSKFIIGMTDWHPGGDALAALRGPERLAIDMISHTQEIEELLMRVEVDYFRIYDLFYQRLRAAGQPISTWLTLVSDEKFYPVCNDFSIMISPAMFERVFLPGIIRECQFLDRSIYHLDGPGALRHLDLLLSIPELDALQWVPGAGNEGYHRWVEVYRRAQAAGKAVQVFCSLDELNLVTETLDPHGVLLSVSDVPSIEAAEALLKVVAQWALRR